MTESGFIPSRMPEVIPSAIPAKGFHDSLFILLRHLAVETIKVLRILGHCLVAGFATSISVLLLLLLQCFVTISLNQHHSSFVIRQAVENFC